MDDNFLHRIRAEPPPEFLAGLKARLDREAPARNSARRPSGIRILVAALMIGGSAFAITALSITGIPPTVRNFLHIPSTVPVTTNTHKPTPGPAAEDFANQDGSADSQTRNLRGPPVRQSRPGGPIAAETNGKSVAEVSALKSTGQRSTMVQNSVAGLPTSKSRDYISIVGPAALPAMEFAEGLARNIGLRNIGLKLRGYTVGSTDEALVEFCNGVGADFRDIAATDRRITADEFKTCRKNGVNGIIEVKLGYQAVVLIRSKMNGALKLSARDVFLALAKQIPSSGDPRTLIKNPNSTWNQVSPALGYEQIQFIGPSLSSIAGNTLMDLVLETGCNTYPWIAALKKRDESHYNEVCRTVRDDGTYIETIENPVVFAQQIEINPSAIGISGYEFFRRNDDKFLGSLLDGIAPDFQSVAAGTYPASRTLYLYVKKQHVPLIPGIMEFITSILRDLAAGPMFGNWAIVLPDEAERRAIRADALALKELQL